MANLARESLNLNAELDEIAPYSESWERRSMFTSLLNKALAIRSSQNLQSNKGAVLFFRAGDGHAIYIVTKARPLTLTHVYIGDGWQTAGVTINGVNAQYVKDTRIKADNGWYPNLDKATEDDVSFVNETLQRLLPDIFTDDLELI